MIQLQRIWRSKMKNLLSKIPFISKLFNKDDDWHEPKYILKVINEKELRKIRKRILKDLKKEKVINPKALFYLRKYVDASFNKKTVNISGRFIEKQNKLEQLYATGKAEIYELIAEYYDILREIREADERLKKEHCTHVGDQRDLLPKDGHDLQVRTWWWISTASGNACPRWHLT